MSTTWDQRLLHDSFHRLIVVRPTSAAQTYLLAAPLGMARVEYYQKNYMPEKLKIKREIKEVS